LIVGRHQQMKSWGVPHQSKLDFLLYEIPTTTLLKKVNHTKRRRKKQQHLKRLFKKKEN
jgi:hypothetical protein